MSEARIKANAKYDANNTKRYGIKLNINTDAEIIEFLDNTKNKQGLIKQLLQEYMDKQKQE